MGIHGHISCIGAPNDPPMKCFSCRAEDALVSECDLCGGDRCTNCTQYIDCDECEDKEHTLCICGDCAEQ